MGLILKKKITKKNFYSFHDSSVYELITPKFQHQLISSKAKENNGEIIFYTSEDPKLNKKNRIVYEKLAQKPNVKGFIFLHLQQLAYSGKIDTTLIKKILQYNYEIHFCKEDLSLYKINDYSKNVNNFIIFDKTKKLVNLKK